MADHREIAFEAAIVHAIVTTGGYTQASNTLYDRAAHSLRIPTM